MRGIPSGLQAASAAIHAGPCWYLGCTLVTDLSNKDVIATVWDSPDTTTTNDTVVDYLQATDETPNACHVMVEPIWCSKGISVLLDAAEGDYVVWYSL